MLTRHPMQHGNRDHFPLIATLILCHQTPLEFRLCSLGAPFSVGTVGLGRDRGTPGVVLTGLEARTVGAPEGDRMPAGMAAVGMGDTLAVVGSARSDVRWRYAMSRAAHLQIRVEGCCPG